ncbi:MAG: DNA-directed RNA polymerase subunit alpha, partial [Gammaproteobacteria bacterium]
MQESATEFLKPKAVKVQPMGGNRARVTVEPFERGFG